MISDQNVSIYDPDQPYDIPIYEGMASNAYRHLIHGTYPAVTWQGIPVFVKISNGSWIVEGA